MRTLIGIHRYGGDGEPVTRAVRLRMGFKGGSVAEMGETVTTRPADTVTASARSCALREVKLPFPDPRKAAQVAPFEVEGKIPYDMDEVVTSHEPLSAGPDGTRLLLAAAPEDHIEDLVADWGTAAQQPQVILPEAVALFTFARHLTGFAGEPLLVVDVRRDRLLLVALAQGRWQGSRTVTIGWDPVREALPHGGVGSALRRAAQSLYMKADADPMGILVVGEGQGESGEIGDDAAEALAKELSLPRVPLSAFSGQFPEAQDGRLSVYAVATGLALAAADGKRRMNLRGGSFALSRAEESETLHRLTGLGVGVLLVLVVAWASGFVRHSAAEARFEAAKQTVEEQYRQAFPDAVRVVNPLVQARTELKKLETRSLLFGGGGTTALGHLNAISAAIPRELTIDVSEFSVEGTRLRMEAEVKSFDAIDQVKTILEGLPAFSEVRVSDAKASAKENRVKFRVSVTLAEGV